MLMDSRYSLFIEADMLSFHHQMKEVQVAKSKISFKAGGKKRKRKKREKEDWTESVI